MQYIPQYHKRIVDSIKEHINNKIFIWNESTLNYSENKFLNNNNIPIFFANNINDVDGYRISCNEAKFNDMMKNIAAQEQYASRKDKLLESVNHKTKIGDNPNVWEFSRTDYGEILQWTVLLNNKITIEEIDALESLIIGAERTGTYVEQICEIGNLEYIIKEGFSTDQTIPTHTIKYQLTEGNYN